MTSSCGLCARAVPRRSDVDSVGRWLLVSAVHDRRRCRRRCRRRWSLVASPPQQLQRWSIADSYLPYNSRRHRHATCTSAQNVTHLDIQPLD